MLNLLIVDDEPLITDSLYDLFLDFHAQDFNLMKAYSGREASSLMETVRIDVLLTDISMPDVNGMEVHRRAQALWPDCAVIYLTSFGEFSYVQQAIRNHGEDYILKTEGDAAVLAAVERAAAHLAETRRDRRLLERAKNDLTLAMPLLQARYLSEIAEGGGALPENLGAELMDLELPLDGDRPVLLLTGRIDAWPEEISAAGRLMLAGRVRNAMESHFAGAALAACTILRPDMMLAFIQPEPQQGGEAYGVLALQLKASLDELQALCRESYRVTISLAAASSPVEWAQVSQQCEALRRLLDNAAGIGGALLIHDPLQHEAESPNANRIVAFVEEYTRRHIGDDLSLTRFATLLNFHPFYLSRVFKHYAGRSLTEYVAEARMDRARELLRGGSMKISDISAALGFKTSSYFTCFFRKFAGMSPMEYRNCV